MVLGKRLLLTLVGDLNETARTFMEKDIDVLAHESKEEREETGLKKEELSNGGKPAWFNVKDTAIL